MRGGRDEEKVTSPMFPRLHVNDTEKGGPRAPPRNKMALYEQLSVPSQRLASGSASMLSMPQNNSNSLVPSTPSSHVAAYKSMFSPFCNSRVPSYMAEKFHSDSSSVIKPNTNTVVSGHERKSMKPTNQHNLNAVGQYSSTAKCDSSQHNISNFNSFSFKEYRNEDEFVVPSSAPRFCSIIQQNKERETLPQLSLNSMVQPITSCEKQVRGATDLKPRYPVRNHIEDNPKMYQTSQNSVERSASVPFATDKNFVDTSPCPSTAVKNSKTSKQAHASLSEHKTDSTDNLNEDCLGACDKMSLGGVIRAEPTRGMVKEISSNVHLRSESCSKPLLVDDRLGEKNCGTLQVGIEERHDVSETSMVDTLLHQGVSPDEVVGVIGEKHYLRARRAIVNQQRIFALQVFELHRLIKVQRLIAESPHVLNEENLYLRKRALEISPVKKLSLQFVLEPPSPIAKSKDNPQKPNPGGECADENAVKKFPLPSVYNDTSRTEQSNYAQYPRNPPPTPPTNNNKPAQWWIHPPPGNQWLVPVMSPSEGLVYKPYTGIVCPSTGGFMAPMYGNCGPVNLNPGSGDFLNAAYGFPASNHQGNGILPGTHPLGQTYFPPYGMPVTNPSVSSFAIEQMSPLGGGRSNEQENQLSNGKINSRILNQSSCNMPSQTSHVMSCHVRKHEAPKGSEIHGSTASSPSGRTQGDALPLFPMVPTDHEPDQNTQSSEPKIRAIKVVPYNPRSASESAARIFQSIQEERKHL